MTAYCRTDVSMRPQVVELGDASGLCSVEAPKEARESFMQVPLSLPLYIYMYIYVFIYI